MANSMTISICFMVICIGVFQFVLSDQRICGPGLRETLKLVCPDGFNGYKAKRGSIMLGDDYDNSNDVEEDFALSLDLLPFWNSMKANSLAKTRRRRHGIVHECCDKACSVEELKSYCHITYT